MNNHIQLLCDLSELNWVFNDTTGVDSFLQKTVDMVARHMKADVCSIYLYDEAGQVLILRATKGLNPSYVNQIKLALGEGLTGLAVKEMRPICEQAGSRHPGYKFFAGLQEEQFDSFLAVPLLRGVQKVGALVVQRKGNTPFDPHEVDTLKAVSGQLVNAVEYARTLLSVDQSPQNPAQNKHRDPLPRFIRGKSASPGFALAPISLFDRYQMHDILHHRSWPRRYTLKEFRGALQSTHAQLEQYQERLAQQLADIASLIFAAHLLMLQDHAFAGKIEQLIAEGVNPPEAVLKVADHFIQSFSAHENASIREKADDVRDVSIRLMRNLTEQHHDHDLLSGTIVIARSLLPSDILILSLQQIKGIVLVEGGVTSHLSVLARSLELPVIIADCPALLSAPENTVALIDAEIGNLYIDPDKEVLATFEQRNRAREQTGRVAAIHTPGPATTSCGQRVRLYANINLLSDLKAARALHAEGVGLYRTEFPFMIRNSFPTEEEQFGVYRTLLDGMRGNPVVFRTLDIGGDKELAYTAGQPEKNPFLGLRSLRFTLANRDIFKQQLRAILRASVGADIGIMFPMVSSLDEFIQAREVLDECIRELQSANTPFNGTPRMGIMVELPGIIDIIEAFAGKVDFFSIGTNDLIQYTLAVDRTNERVAHLYTAEHPAVLRSIKRIADAAIKNGILLAVCGDMAHDERLIPFLLGVGIRTFSVEPVYLNAVRAIIAATAAADATRFASALLKCTTISAIRAKLLIPLPNIGQ